MKLFRSLRHLGLQHISNHLVGAEDVSNTKIYALDTYHMYLFSVLIQVCACHSVCVGGGDERTTLDAIHLLVSCLKHALLLFATMASRLVGPRASSYALVPGSHLTAGELGLQAHIITYISICVLGIYTICSWDYLLSHLPGSCSNIINIKASDIKINHISFKHSAYRRTPSSVLESCGIK